MPIYNGNRARQGAHQGLFVRQVEERRKHTTFNQEFLQQEHPCMKILHCPWLQNFGGGDADGDEGDDGADMIFVGKNFKMWKNVSVTDGLPPKRIEKLNNSEKEIF